MPQPRRQPESISLGFDPERISFSFTVREKLNDHRYSDMAKIKFLKDVIAYKEKDILNSMEFQMKPHINLVILFLVERRLSTPLLVFENGINLITHKKSCAHSDIADIAFVVDATGSRSN